MARLSTVAERARLGQAIAAARQHGVDRALVQKAEAALAQARAATSHRPLCPQLMCPTDDSPTNLLPWPYITGGARGGGGGAGAQGRDVPQR